MPVTFSPVKTRWVIVATIGVMSFLIAGVSFSLALAPDAEDETHAALLNQKLQSVTKQGATQPW